MGFAENPAGLFHLKEKFYARIILYVICFFTDIPIEVDQLPQQIADHHGCDQVTEATSPETNRVETLDADVDITQPGVYLTSEK